jgi:hypothetical protein
LVSIRHGGRRALAREPPGAAQHAMAAGNADLDQDPVRIITNVIETCAFQGFSRSQSNHGRDSLPACEHSAKTGL